MSKETRRPNAVPDWVLAFGPFVVIGAVVVASFGIVSAFEFDWLTADGTGNVLAVLTLIGIVAGILPVFLGMLWFPYIRGLDPTWIHAILAFIAFEMGEEAIEQAAAVPDATTGVAVVLVGAIGTIAAMEAASRWRRNKAVESGTEGLRVAYLIAIGLGLHSVGEGLAIGSAFVLGNSGLVVLLTIGFIIHNVTEGPAVISAVARDATSPPLRHFAVLGTLAGGGVIVGGWLGSAVDSGTDPRRGGHAFHPPDCHGVRRRGCGPVRFRRGHRRRVVARVAPDSPQRLYTPTRNPRYERP